MHDPDVVAHEIKFRWPRHKRRVILVTVWHHEPGGAESLTVCKRDSNWRWHIRHWRVQFPFLQAWRRRLLTRCAWCGGRHTKKNPIDMSRNSWGSDPASTPWWRGEQHLDHHECAEIYHAHLVCLCDAPVLSQGDYGQCAECGKHRAWSPKSRYGRPPSIVERYLATIPEGQRVPDHKRPWIQSEYAKARAEREAADGR